MKRAKMDGLLHEVLGSRVAGERYRDPRPDEVERALSSSGHRGGSAAASVAYALPAGARVLPAALCAFCVAAAALAFTASGGRAALPALAARITSALPAEPAAGLESFAEITRDSWPDGRARF